jgi:regulator of nucleoside diphosphate kinase
MIVTEADFANLSLLKSHPALGRMLEQAEVVASDAVPPDLVTMQSRLVLVDEAGGERRIVSVVYPAEADPAAGRISVLDALGMALLGASPGHAVECDSPAGSRYLRIEKILYQPEHSLRTFMVVRER